MNEFDVSIPPETELLFKYLEHLKEQLEAHGQMYSVDELYDDLPTRAYFMLGVVDETDFYSRYSA